MADDFQIDRAFLEKLERLTIRWRKSFPGLVGGHNVSHFAGPGQEFLDHRNLHQGDELRAVNWRAYMRLDKMFLKMFQVEPRVPVRLLLDVSQSMATASASGPNSDKAEAKFDYARRLAAALTYVALVRLDTMSIQPFRETLGDSIGCGGGRHQFAPVANFLRTLAPGGKTRFFDMSRKFISENPQRGLVIVISDFLDDEDCLKPLQYLSDFGHELLLIQLWADEDRTPPWNGELALTQAESGEEMEISFDDAARVSYTQAFDEYANQIQRLALRNGGRYAGISTSMPVEDAIFGPVMRPPEGLRG